MKILIALIKKDKTWEPYLTWVPNNITDLNQIFEKAKLQTYEDRMKDPERFPKDLIGVHPIKILKDGEVV